MRAGDSLDMHTGLDAEAWSTRSGSNTTHRGPDALTGQRRRRAELIREAEEKKKSVGKKKDGRRTHTRPNNARHALLSPAVTPTAGEILPLSEGHGTGREQELVRVTSSDVARLTVQAVVDLVQLLRQPQ